VCVFVCMWEGGGFINEKYRRDKMLSRESACVESSFSYFLFLVRVHVYEIAAA
jgi:hypothetical protein